ncbi:MerR family transcriptional regulator [Aestuariibius sp. 2305UL40-4]
MTWSNSKPVSQPRLGGDFMRISEAASASGLKADTIRYYEAEGLVPNVMRGSDGQRRFSRENVEWLTLLYWLRETGMPMKVMQRFAALYAQGDETIPARKAILLDHSERLARRRSDLDRCEEILVRKLEIYEEYLR